MKIIIEKEKYSCIKLQLAYLRTNNNPYPRSNYSAAINSDYLLIIIGQLDKYLLTFILELGRFISFASAGLESRGL